MERIGAYRLERELSGLSGGLRRYSGVHERTGRRATIALSTDVDEPAASRMLRQVRAWARVVHPSISTITDMGVADDRLYCVTSAQEGAQSATRLLPKLRDPLRVLMPIVHAMAIAHQEGARHGALDPSCIELVRDGRDWSARLTPHCTLKRARRRDDVRAMANLLRRCKISRPVRRVLSQSSTMTMMELYESLLEVSPSSVRARMDSIAGARDDLVSSGTTSLHVTSPDASEDDSISVDRSNDSDSRWKRGACLALAFGAVAALSFAIVRLVRFGIG